MIYFAVPIGSRDIRHPSVTDGVREAWSIAVDGLVLGFSATSVEAPTPIISSLTIDGAALSQIFSDDSIRL